MTLSRRDLFRLGSAAGVTLVLPRLTGPSAPQGQVTPHFSLTGGATADGVLVSTSLSRKDAWAYADLAVSASSDMSNSSLVGLEQAGPASIVQHLVTGRAPNSFSFARLVSNGQMVGETVRFKTLPLGSGSWTRKVAVVSCQGNAANRYSTELAWADILAWGAEDIWHLGDWGYWGQLIPPSSSYLKDLLHYTSSMHNFPTMRHAIQSADLNVVMISDHELTIGGDPEGGSLNSPESIRELVAFQKLMPVRAFGDTRNPRRGRYYSFDIGTQVRVIVTDFRSPDRSNATDPDGPLKTMFGATQLAWLLGTLDPHKVNLIANETAWLATPNQHDGRATDKPWHYFHEQQIIADYITQGGYQVAWIGGDRHYVGYLAGQGTPHNTLGGFPCYISSGTAKESLDRQPGELMSWQFGADWSRKRPVCGYLQVTLSYDEPSHQLTLSGLGRGVLDTTENISEWTVRNIPGGTARDVWSL